MRICDLHYVGLFNTNQTGADGHVQSVNHLKILKNVQNRNCMRTNHSIKVSDQV